MSIEKYRILYVVEYYDDAVFSYKDNKISELALIYQNVKYIAYTDVVDLTSEEKIAKFIDNIRKIVKKDSMGDLIRVSLYEIRVDKNYYDNLIKSINNKNENETILEIYRANLFNKNISIITSFRLNLVTDLNSIKYIS